MNRMPSHRKLFSSIFISPLVFLVLVGVTYYKVFATFYQQDEWQTIGHMIGYGWAGLILRQSLPQLIFAQGRILAILFYSIVLARWQTGVFPAFAVAIFFHASNGYLVYQLAKKLNGGPVAAWAGALFFVLNSVSDQAVLWASAVNTILATTIVFLSFLFYIDFLKTNNAIKKHWAFILGIASLFVKETGSFVFILYPLFFAFWHKTRNVLKIVTAHRGLLAYGLFMLLFRVIEIFLAPRLPGFVSDQTGGFFFRVVYQSISYPLVSFFQLFWPPADVYAFVPAIVQSQYTLVSTSPLATLIGQSAVADGISLLGGILIGGTLILMIVHDKQRKVARHILFFGFVVFFLSFLPYAVLQKVFSYMSSRYYYVGVAGGAFLFGYMVDWILRRLPLFGKVLLMVGLAGYLFHHVQAIKTDIDAQVQVAHTRKAFLSSLMSITPPLADKNVFYIKGDKPFLGDITYPFQNGLGYILEVVYYDTGKIPKEFLSSDFLWDLGSEGYREQGTYGFGYFEHLDSLASYVQKGSVDPAIVRAYAYTSATGKMIDITAAMQTQLATLSATLQ